MYLFSIPTLRVYFGQLSTSVKLLHITSLFPHSLTTSRSHSSVFHRSGLDLKSLNGYGYVDDVMAVGRLLQNHVA